MKLSKLFLQWLGHCEYQEICPLYRLTGVICNKEQGLGCGKHKLLKAKENSGGIKVHV